jgi:23S rRNA (cytosine1962-C5)-methyltransferase
LGNPADGDVISLKDGRDRFLGSAIYNSKSQIVARRFSRRRQSLDLDFFQRRIAQAIEYRERRGIISQVLPGRLERERRTSGVIVDRYGDCFVLQTLTLAMDQRKELIVRALKDCFSATTAASPGDRNTDGTAPVPPIIERNDAPVRRAEGMELRTGVLSGEAPGAVEMEIAGGKIGD